MTPLPPAPASPTPDDLSRFRSLARLIARGDCVLVLGPGAAVAPNISPELPLSVVLSERLAKDERVRRAEGLDQRDLRHVSQVLYQATRSLTDIQDIAADFYSSVPGTTPFHVNMAALPFKFCLTTTPDDLFFNALKQAGKTPIRDFYNFRRTRPSESLLQPTIQRPLLYHLYGYHEEPDSLVITESDLIDFVTKVIRNDPPLASIVRAELAKPTTTCLFIDLGFKHWYLRALLRALDLHGHQDASIALEDADFFAQSGLHQTTVYFSASQAIQFRQESLDEFSTRLRAVSEALTRQPAKETIVLPPGVPKVFLSYLREDREIADRLVEHLREGGVNVWQDVQNLRVGDRWAQVIDDVINKQVDYVAVLQTPALFQQIETYVGIELSQALARQKRVIANRFVLPLRVGVDIDLRDLREFNGIDVGSDIGVRALIASIQDDWKDRKARSLGAAASAI